MNQVLEELQSFQSHHHKAFQRMVVLSVLLHIIIFACLISNKYNRSGSKSVPFMDLTMSSPASAPAEIAHHSQVNQPTPPSPVTAPPPVVTPPSELQNLQSMIEKNIQPSNDDTTDLHKVSLGLGATRGYFRSLGQGETLRDEIQNYYFEILQVINEQWWIDKSIDRKGVRELVINVVIGRDGTIVDKQLLQTSGNREYDSGVLKALETVGPLSPLPQTYNGNFFVAPIRLVAPLNLLAS